MSLRSTHTYSSALYTHREMGLSLLFVGAFFFNERDASALCHETLTYSQNFLLFQLWTETTHESSVCNTSNTDLNPDLLESLAHTLKEI